jgi:ABC-type multidrug transport system permease subunit
MVFSRIIKKNFTLLARSRSSAFMLLLGPLIVIALVGLFLSGKSTYDLSVGYYSPAETNLSREFIDALEESDFSVIKFSSEQACVDTIKQGAIHTCIIFPKNFEVKNSRSAEMRFVVDYSRINLVYKVIDAVSFILENETNEVSKGLTNSLLDKINQTMLDIGKNQVALEQVKQKNALMQTHIDDSASVLAEISFDTDPISLVPIYRNFNNTNESMEWIIAVGNLVVMQSRDLHEDLDSYIDNNRSNALLDEINYLNESLSEKHNWTSSHLDTLYDSITNLQEGIAEIEEQARINEGLSQQVTDSIVESRRLSGELKNDIDTMRSSFSSMDSRLKSITINKAETIVNPVNAKIEPVLEESSNLQSTAPYLLVLIIMFVSLMISSTLVIFEKNSKAVFRNFMTPVQEKVFILSTFFTVLLIVLVQALIIILASQVFLGQNLLAKPGHVFIAIIVCIMFFSVIGMAIGRFFSTQDGVMMTSLVLGSVFLFLSNLVIPIESIAPSLASIVRLNPFVMFSELIRGPMMFSTVAPGFALKIGILLFITLSILTAMLLGKGFFFKKKFGKIKIFEKAGRK